MNTSAQPADLRASRTRGTVKKRTMTWGRPAVPIISDMASIIILKVLPSCMAVYRSNPRSTSIWSSVLSRCWPWAPPTSSDPPRPSWGRGLPVSCREMNTAGTV
ncbi:hypothetical protein KBTX_04248 [wastewater metagenome]|uniref:Uncharacterized protein n=2 Tax=unclassified sequences TaxID=12908 RepID=A0A5B8RJK6_9ZZZZ|nr:hypothetical protein KBTEX_04248 [uncultured organism]